MANPDKLKVLKQHSLKGIAFTAFRGKDAPLTVYGDSEFKVNAVDPLADKWEPREIGKHSSYVTGVVLAGQQVISGGYDGQLIWWNLTDKSQIRTVDAHKKWIRNLTLAPDGNTLVSVADDMVARIWDVKSGKMLHELKGHKEKTPSHFASMLFNAAYSHDGKHLATVDKVGVIKVWDTANGRELASLEAPGLYTWDPKQRIHSIGGIRAVAFSPDGKSLAVGGIGHIGNVDHLDGPARVEVFDWKSGKRTHEFAKTKFKGIVNRLLFDPQGSWLLAAGGAGDGFLFFLDLAGNKVTREEKAPMHVHALTLDGRGETIAAFGHGKVIVYDLKG